MRVRQTMFLLSIHCLLLTGDLPLFLPPSPSTPINFAKAVEAIRALLDGHDGNDSGDNLSGAESRESIDNGGAESEANSTTRGRRRLDGEDEKNENVRSKGVAASDLSTAADRTLPGSCWTLLDVFVLCLQPLEDGGLLQFAECLACMCVGILRFVLSCMFLVRFKT